jgi:hypothetical protein
MDINSEQQDLLKLDKIFPSLPDSDKFDIALVIPSGIKFQDGILSIPPESRVSDLLQKYGYARITTAKHSTYPIYFAELTDKGREAKKAGGHFPYLTNVANKERKERDRQRKADEISKYDLLQKKYFYKSRYVPHIFSTLALIGTAFSITIAFKALYKSESITPKTIDATQAMPKSVTSQSLIKEPK